MTRPFRVAGESWEWLCPSTGQLIRPDELGPFCAAGLGPEGFVVLGIVPFGAPQFCGVYPSWDGAAAAAARHVQRLPELVRRLEHEHRRLRFFNNGSASR